MSIVANFPGIDPLLKTTDAVVVARIQKHLPSSEIRFNDTSEFYECTIEQTLQGKLLPRTNVVLCIEYFPDEFFRPLRQSTVVILFLRKRAKGAHGCEYYSPRMIGAAIEIAPVGSEAVSQKGTSKARIKALIRHYRQYRAQKLQKEEERLQEVLRS